MAADADIPVLYCEQEDIEYVLSVVGLSLALDDDRDASIADSPDSTYLTNCIQYATAFVNSKLSKRYDYVQLARSAAVKEATAVLAAKRARRHAADPLPEALAEWAEEVEDWLDEVRDGEADLGLIPERSPARPGVINQRHDIRWPNPSRLQHNQSTPVVGKRPFGQDLWDEVVAGI
jgi:hypothetical protein